MDDPMTAAIRGTCGYVSGGFGECRTPTCAVTVDACKRHQTDTRAIVLAYLSTAAAQDPRQYIRIAANSLIAEIGEPR